MCGAVQQDLRIAYYVHRQNDRHTNILSTAALQHLGVYMNVLTAALFWNITQNIMAIFVDVSGQPIGPIFNVLDFLHLEVGTDNLSRNFSTDLPLDAP
jgi:hypothetical protein